MPIFDIELTTHCNANCIMCPRERITRPKSTMQPALLDYIVNWLPSDARAMLAGLGEPLLNSYLVPFVSQLAKRGIITGITTNGVLLSSKKISELTKSGLRLLQISFNGSNRDRYEEIMLNCDYQTVMKNLEYLSKNRPEELEVKLAVTRQEKNANDINKIKLLADSLGFGVHIRNCHSRASASATYSRAGCGIFEQITFIAGNGDVLSCCQDLGGVARLGNVKDESFLEITKKKEKIVSNNAWPDICSYCDDDYRYFLLDNKL